MPPPEELPGDREIFERTAAGGALELEPWMTRDRPIEQRYADPIDWQAPVVQEPRQRVWLRAAGSLPEERDLHQAVLAYASDMSLLDAATMPHAISYSDDRMQIASLDHAMWFHRDFCADEWLYYVSDSPAAANARGFARGTIYDRTGRLVASVAQEGLLRRHGDG